MTGSNAAQLFLGFKGDQFLFRLGIKQFLGFVGCVFKTAALASPTCLL